ncbi:S24 family peptidase [Piscirickettsia litoralis]|uniref:HTH cro/C1-type domain-containing protein n=1 Tax=Piscirickettsia litoralis TaxID=1891921 RepID=A0ABX3A7L8_9GAMM|nr:S24 family peptidase [Piscirickettsia litoralis]ODN43701.1 hypothetical protein BGC07_13315 [Piscirickettsia litoralis]
MTLAKKNLHANNPSIKERLNHLMNEIRISEAELARQTGVPTTTINRMLLGHTTDPRANTLKPLAQFFSISIDQLLGLSPMNDRIPGTFNATNRSAWLTVPLIRWQDSIAWVFKHNSYSLDSHTQWITTDKHISDTSFAVKSLPSMEPRFREGSTLIVDPNHEYKDGMFVLVTLDGSNVVARSVLSDGADIYFKGFDHAIPTQAYNSTTQRILGVIVEARMNLYK